jgi:hypothetical protein
VWNQPLRGKTDQGGGSVPSESRLKAESLATPWGKNLPSPALKTKKGPGSDQSKGDGQSAGSAGENIVRPSDEQFEKTIGHDAPAITVANGWVCLYRDLQEQFGLIRRLLHNFSTMDPAKGKLVLDWGRMGEILRRPQAGEKKFDPNNSLDLRSMLCSHAKKILNVPMDELFQVDYSTKSALYDPKPGGVQENEYQHCYSLDYLINALTELQIYAGLVDALYCQK